MSEQGSTVGRPQATPPTVSEPALLEPSPQQIELGSDPPARREDAPQAQPFRNVSAAWLGALGATLVSRVVLMLVAYLGAWLLASGTGPLQQGVFDLWNKWDAPHLLVIAQHGYFAPESDAHAAAFFPLFPLVVRLVMFVIDDPVRAGMAVSFIASVIAGRYLYGLSEMKKAGSGGRALAFFVFFPTALFLVAPYTEALFLAGAIAAFYYAKQGRWLLVAFPAAVAMGARAAGVFLLAGLAMEFVVQRDYSRARVREAGTALVAASLPLVAYFSYLQSRTGNFFYYFQMQEEGWGRSFTSPRDSFLLTWRTWNASTDTNWIMVWRLEIIAALLGVVVVAWAWRRRESGYTTYMGLSLAALLTSTWYFSIPRMMLSFFPIAIFMATARRVRHDYVLAASAGLAVLGTIVFTRGAWFF